MPLYAPYAVQRYNLPILDFLDWIRRLLWQKRSHSSNLPYTRIETWGGLEGYLHLVERQVRDNEPRAIATFLFRRKRFNGYRKTAGPMDVYIDIKRSKIEGHSHTVIVVEAENQIRSDRFCAVPLHYGEYQWVKRGRPLITARRRELIDSLKTTSINTWEDRDRTAVLITIGACFDLLKRPSVDWRSAIAREERLLTQGNDSSKKPGSLKGDRLSGYLIDKDPRSWD